MKTINLSAITGWNEMTADQVIDSLLDKKLDGIINDYGDGKTEYALDDLLIIWDTLRQYIACALFYKQMKSYRKFNY